MNGSLRSGVKLYNHFLDRLLYTETGRTTIGTDMSLPPLLLGRCPCILTSNAYQHDMTLVIDVARTHPPKSWYCGLLDGSEKVR